MPNIKSAVKRMRQNTRRRAANRAQRSAFRTEIKKTRVMIAEATVETLPAQVSSAVSILDKAAKKGLIHKNKAARHASRLMRQANAAAAQDKSAS